MPENPENDNYLWLHKQSGKSHLNLKFIRCWGSSCFPISGWSTSVDNEVSTCHWAAGSPNGHILVLQNVKIKNKENKTVLTIFEF